MRGRSCNVESFSQTAPTAVRIYCVYVCASERQLCTELTTYFLELANIVICSEVQIIRLFYWSLIHNNDSGVKMTLDNTINIVNNSTFHIVFKNS